MNAIELENKLKNLGYNVSNRAISNIIGITEQYYSNKKKNGTDFKQADIEKIEKKFNISLMSDLMVNDSMVTIEASCGTGVINADIDYLQLDNKQKYIYCFANGDSMESNIKSGDCCLIQLQETIDRENDIYFFTYSNEQYLKRISKNLNQLIISSDNKKYPDIILKEQELDAIRVIGRCCGIIRRL